MHFARTFLALRLAELRERRTAMRAVPAAYILHSQPPIIVEPGSPAAAALFADLPSRLPGDSGGQGAPS